MTVTAPRSYSPHQRDQHLKIGLHVSSDKEIVLGIKELLVEIAEQLAASLERYRCRAMKASDDKTLGKR